MAVRPEQQKINLNAAKANAIYFFSAMLPSFDDPARLVTFGPALYARLEKVQSQKKQLEGQEMIVSEANRPSYSKLLLEEQMLQQVIEWTKDCDLETNP